MTLWFPRRGGKETLSRLPGTKSISTFSNSQNNCSKEQKILEKGFKGILLIVSALLLLSQVLKSYQP